jgi:hypothetical protein
MSLNLHSQSIHVRRLELITILETNMAKHAAEYSEAMVNYRKAVIVDLQEALAKANDEEQDISKVSVQFIPPVSHEAEYSRVIKMLKLSVDDSIEIDNQAYDAYVEDEWQWKKNFSVMNSIYATKAATYQSN